MVEFIDGSLKAQMGLPDMKIPIQYALTHPERLPMNGKRIDFSRLGSMTFFEPDRKKFRCLQIAFDVLSLGGTAPAAMNAANEVAVEAFLGGKISFKKIPELIEGAVATHKTVSTPDLEDIIKADTSARNYVRSLI
jgi:1-deoxy-D-xylulose-5-phosphate reductoisomerase